MYIFPNAGLGQAKSIRGLGLIPWPLDPTKWKQGNCSGWMSDAESFSKVVADHYLRTEYPSLFGQAEKIWCRGDRKLCEVSYPSGVSVGVSFVSLPHFVIARRVPHPTGPRCEYEFHCLPSGKLVPTKRSCAPS
jgi:hypothetical protein